MTNFYPPLHRGGYEIWCQEAATSLRTRGHEVVILTSTHRRSDLNAPEDDWIIRELHLEMDLDSSGNALNFFTSRSVREQQNLEILGQILSTWMPDTILIWGMWNLQKSLAALAESQLTNEVAYYIADYWPIQPSQLKNYWLTPGKNLLTRVPKLTINKFALRILAKEEETPLEFRNVMFPSKFMQSKFASKGISPQKVGIVTGGIDTSPFQNRPKSTDFATKEHISLLFAGRLSIEKGVETAIQAIGILRNKFGITNIELNLVGTGDTQYTKKLIELTNSEGVRTNVNFLGFQPRDKMPAIYQKNDIFLFTSIWPEPFGRVIVEAMASGLAVVASGTGGSAEILEENENCLLFEPGNAQSLALMCSRLMGSPKLYQAIVFGGQETARSKFNLSTMVDGIEDFLCQIFKNCP